ncbi:MAG TPA: NAD-dependent epimerase/dehydratase family protein [Gaiellaceae bacterium]|nr:NAD-dependent epimerase/dehydratase family protein [Gaiellaceae bacterium]
MRTAAVTGARGYVGSRVAAALRAAGWQVRELTRSDASLEEGARPGGLDGADLAVHCAWSFAARGRREVTRVNVAGSIRLLDQAAAAGVAHQVWVSSLSAFPGCRSVYGQAKLAVEEHARSLGGVVVRPGLVWGPGAGGMVGALDRAARRLPVIPALAGEVYVAHAEDLGALVAHLGDAEPPPGPVVAAARTPVSTSAILRALAARAGRTPRVLPVPWQLVWGTLRGLELVGFRLRFRSDSVIGLVAADPDPFAHGVAPDPVPFRPFAP